MAGGKNGTKRYGRNKVQCAAYRTAERREISKAYDLIKHLEHQPDDPLAKAALEKIPDHCRKKATKRLADRREAVPA